MIKTKDGYAKLIGTTYLGNPSQVLLSNGGNLEYASSSKADTLVLRNSSLQIYATYFNSAISDEALTDIGSVYVRNTSDSFIRRVSKSQFYSIIDGKFVTLDTALTITGNKTFTTQINSSLSTNTHIEGNKGKTLINSTASAGSYVMLFKGNSTNGYFTHGVYLSKYLLQYTSKTTVDAGTNAVTRSVTLLNESGNSSFPGNVTVSGTISGNILESRVATGTKPLNITSTTLVTNLNSDRLDNYHETAFPRLVGVKSGTWDWNDLTRAGYYKIQGGTISNHPPYVYRYGMALVITTENHADGENREVQIYYPYNLSNNIAVWVRMHNSSIQGNGWGLWRGIPNIDGVTKIKVTLHTTNNTNYPVVWSNQNNTNTGNSDLFKSWDHLYYNPSTHVLTSVGGLMGGFLDIATGDLKITSTTDYRKIQTYDSKPLSINPEGNNVGIGLTNPSYKLHVNGTLRATNTTVADLFVNTGDATLKIYSGKASDGDGKSDGNICFQTSIDSTDGQTHAYPTQYPQRCNISLLPRGGLVYIGTNPSTGNTGNKLYVNGNSYTTGYFSGNTLTARVATGTAPLNITSTTLVNNLNVDFLRGYIPIGTSGSVIRKRGSSVGETTAAWCRMAKYTSNSTDTLTDVAFLLHSSYSGRYSVLHIKFRGRSYVKALLYNSYGMDASKIRVYYDSGKSNIEFYYYAGEKYSVIIAELLYSTGRNGSWDNNITMYEKDTSSPSYSTYVVPEYPSMLNNADSATKLLNPRKLWGQSFDGTADVSGDMTGVGWINNGIKVVGGYDNSHIYGNGHGITFGGIYGYAHCYYNFRPMYGSSSSTVASVNILNASASSDNPTYTTTHSFNGNGIGYHKRALGVNREAPADGYNGGIYANTVLVNDWFRSEGNTGWYSQTYSGGWYMKDTSWVRVWNDKGIYTAGEIQNGSDIRTAGVFTTSNSTILRRSGFTHTNILSWSWDETYGDYLTFNIPGTNDLSKWIKLSSYKGLVSSGNITAPIFIGNLNGTASSANILNLKGEAGSSTGTSLPSDVGMLLYLYLGSGNGPTMYGNFLRIRGNNGGCGELFLGWQGDNNTSGIWYKSKRDVGSWGAWRLVAFTDSNVASADLAIVAEYLSPHYAGGVLTNPLTYFSNSTGVKVAMTGVGGMGSYWTDTLWINGYSGGDVKGMCALHFSKQNGPRFSISYQNHDNNFYGTCYEVWTSYNFNPSSLVSDKIKWAIYQINITSRGATSSKKAGNFDYVSSVSRPSAGTAYIYLNYPSGASKSTIIMNATGHHAGTDWNRVVYACLLQDYGTLNSVKLMLGDDLSLNDGVGTVTFMYVG